MMYGGLAHDAVFTGGQIMLAFVFGAAFAFAALYLTLRFVSVVVKILNRQLKESDDEST